MMYMIRYRQKDCENTLTTFCDDLSSALITAAELLKDEDNTSCEIWEDSICILDYLKE